MRKQIRVWPHRYSHKVKKVTSANVFYDVYEEAFVGLTAFNLSLIKYYIKDDLEVIIKNEKTNSS